MKKQVIIDKAIQQLRIENYSEATVKNYSSALKLFLQYVAGLQVDKITDTEIQSYLYYCKQEKSILFRQ